MLIALGHQKAGGDERPQVKLRDSLLAISSGTGKAHGPGTFSNAVQDIQNNIPIDYTGASGFSSIDPGTGGVTAGYIVWHVENGQFVTIRHIKPDRNSDAVNDSSQSRRYYDPRHRSFLLVATAALPRRAPWRAAPTNTVLLQHRRRPDRCGPPVKGTLHASSSNRARPRRWRRARSQLYVFDASDGAERSARRSWTERKSGQTLPPTLAGTSSNPGPALLAR